MFTPAHLRAPRRDQAILAGLLVALAGSAWLALWLWGASPYGRYLHHDGGVGPLPLEATLFAAGWVLMIVAMMLPSSVPLVMTFRALVGRRRRPGTLVCLLLAGYLAVALCYGLGVCIQDGWHEQLVKRGWLGTQFPNVIRPGLTLAWGGLLLCAVLAYRLVIRPRLRQVAEA